MSRWIVFLLPPLCGCTVETATFQAPFRVEIAAERPYVVIENLNRPRDCRVVPAAAAYPAIYRVAFGPAARAEAAAFARDLCARVTR